MAVKTLTCMHGTSAQIVGFFAGLAVVDIVQLVEAPPGPDDKIAALDQVIAAGGPATNAAVAFAALGGRAILAAPVGTGPLAKLVRADLAACGVEVLDCADPERSGAGLSVSSCTISAATGERSVVSTNARAAVTDAPLRALLDRGADAVRASEPEPTGPPQAVVPDVVLVDGHNPSLAEAALDLADAVGAPVLMDAGSWKDSAAALPGCCDVVAPSARFYPPGPDGPLTEPDDVAAWLLQAGADSVVLTRGPEPALWWTDGSGDGARASGEVPPPEAEVVDTLGAGDVFHGALAHALAAAGVRRREPLAAGEIEDAVRTACRVAAASTTSFGTRAWLTGAVGWAGAPSPDGSAPHRRRSSH